jgi:hypothetical protein
MNGLQIAEAARQIRSGLKMLFVNIYAENAVVVNGILDKGDANHREALRDGRACSQNT